MSNEEIKISFIVPCYNDGDSIEKMVGSLLDQDIGKLEVIIVNDGSTDNSKAVIDALALKDKRVRAIHLEKNQGACIARNIGAKEAKGTYYSFLPADSFLYPGVARTWVEQLDEYPDYDFLYGGYRLVNEDGDWVPNGEYLFDPFDPYLLETTNYIDGSFPIRATKFWEVAKLMNKQKKQVSDGLWDPAVKSLQDWDFWLSVVKEGKGKGIYIQEIFFETTPPHPGGLSFDSTEHWLERLDFIKQKHGIPIRRLCVASLGASWHAKRIAYLLDADFQQMPSRRKHHYDTIYVIGFYPEFAKMQDSIFLNNYYEDKEGRSPCKKIIHFVGTDIWQLRQISLNGLDIWKSYIRNGIDEVLVEAKFTQDELKDILGIEAKIVPIPPAKLYPLMPLPEKFTIAVYQPNTNSKFYMPDLMEEMAKACPDIQFKFFGNPLQVGTHKDIKNIEYVGYINDMEAFIKECSCIVRTPVHDGLPISVLEFLIAGRYAITNVPVNEAYLVPGSDLPSILEAIKQAKEKSEKEGQNTTGSAFWRKEADHDLYRARMKQLTEYEAKDYWDKRAEQWHKTADQYQVEDADIKEFFDEVKPKTMLDLGCGDGKWVPIFEKWGFDLNGYAGVDIAGTLIEYARKRFPSLTFWVERAEKLQKPKKKYDLIFSYTTLEHVRDEDMPAVVKNLQRAGKKLLLIEPTDFETKYYCHNHDYKKYFKVLKEKKLKDKMIYLCELETPKSR